MEKNTPNIEEKNNNSIYSDEFISSLGMERDEKLVDSSYSDFFRNKDIMAMFSEAFDLKDSKTRRILLSLDEADQKSVLTSLTSRLYNNIVNKMDDIDYGTIPNSKGDITKIDNFDKLTECVSLLSDIAKEFKQDTSAMDTVSLAISNIETRKDLFERAFKFDCEIPQMTYNNIVLSIISSVSLLIATCIEFIKTPNKDTFDIVLDKVSYAKTKNNMLFNTLKKFNKICANNNFDKSMNNIIKEKVNGGYSEGAITLGAGVAAKIGIGIAIGAIALIVVKNLFDILREPVYLFYALRVRISDFFDMQADLIQMNIYNLQNNNTMDEEKKEHIIAKQLEHAERFRKYANTFEVKVKKAESDAYKELTQDSKKVKFDDVSNEIPDSAVSALF